MIFEASFAARSSAESRKSLKIKALVGRITPTKSSTPLYRRVLSMDNLGLRGNEMTTIF